MFKIIAFSIVKKKKKDLWLTENLKWKRKLVYFPKLGDVTARKDNWKQRPVRAE